MHPPSGSRLGPNGPVIGPIGYGCWRLGNADAPTVARCIDTALDHGLNLIDTADIYGQGEGGFGAAELRLGEAIAAMPARRTRMILATKGGIVPGVPYNSSAAYLREALDASLTRLQTDYIDLYQVHRPDPLTGPAELAATLDGFVASGKVRAVGLSNVSAAEARSVAAHLSTPLAAIQNEFSCLHPAPLEDGILAYCHEVGSRLLAWSPLAGGAIAAVTDDVRILRVQTVLRRLAEALDAHVTQVAIAFLRALPGPALPIIGTSRAERIAQFSVDRIPMLDRRQWFDTYEAWRGQPMP